MKKTYILPRTRQNIMLAEAMIAESLEFSRDSSKQLNQEGDFLIKGTTSYNVWDDDWSK